VVHRHREDESFDRLGAEVLAREQASH
jgi:hypothetical protein